MSWPQTGEYYNAEYGRIIPVYKEAWADLPNSFDGLAIHIKEKTMAKGTKKPMKPSKGGKGGKGC